MHSRTHTHTHKHRTHTYSLSHTQHLLTHSHTRARHTHIPTHARTLCRIACVRLPGLELIKRDEGRAFFFSTSEFSAIAAGLVALHMCTDVEDAHPRLRGGVHVSVGVARGGDGKALVFGDDYYGDCVNVASKLGESYCSTMFYCVPQCSNRAVYSTIVHVP